MVERRGDEMSGTGFVARVRTRTGKGSDAYSCASGARRSWSGRRTPTACWHAYRDVLEAMFGEYPDARARTSLAVYRGLDGFKRDYPDTAYRNIGSQMCPAYMPELCDC